MVREAMQSLMHPQGWTQRQCNRSCTLRDGNRGNANAHAPSGMDTEAMQPLMHPQEWTQRRCNSSCILDTKALQTLMNAFLSTREKRSKCECPLQSCSQALIMNAFLSTRETKKSVSVHYIHPVHYLTPFSRRLGLQFII